LLVNLTHLGDSINLKHSFLLKASIETPLHYLIVVECQWTPRSLPSGGDLFIPGKGQKIRLSYVRRAGRDPKITVSSPCPRLAVLPSQQDALSESIPKSPPRPVDELLLFQGMTPSLCSSQKCEEVGRCFFGLLSARPSTATKKSDDLSV